MKRIIYLLTILLFCNLTMQAKERIVEQPAFSTWSSTSLEIAKVVLSDTATVLYIDAFYQPNQWIKIAKGSYLQADGKKYFLKQGIGMEADKEIWMPESGTYSFQMVFPTLPADTKEIDFTEGDFDGSFSVWGIRLDGKAATSPLASKKNPKDAPVLEIPELKSGTAIFNGHVAGYQPCMNLKGKIWATNILTNNYEEYSFSIEPNGTFRCEIPLLHITQVYMHSPFLMGNLFLKPGEETFVEVNYPEVCRSKSRLQKDKPAIGEKYYFSGAMATLNNEVCNNPITLRLSADSQESYMKMQEDLSALDASGFKNYWNDKLANETAKLDKEGSQISDAYRQILLSYLQIEVAINLCVPKQMIKSAYNIVHKSSSMDSSIPEDKLPIITREYFDDNFRTLIANDPMALYTNAYPHLLSILRFTDFSGKATPEEVMKLDTIPFLSEVIGADSGLLFDLIKAQKMAVPITEFTPLNNEQLNRINTLPVVLKEALIAMNEKTKQLIEENKKRSGYTIDRVNIADIPSEELFNAITTPYRDKVVFVDFWETWCSPCREAMKLAEPVKKELEGKDIVFLYLASESSPKSAWNKMIPDIKGEHYRVSNDQWEYWVKKFGINGVPSYMILAKDGSPAYFQIGFMGAEKMKALLLKELEK